MALQRPVQPLERLAHLGHALDGLDHVEPARAVGWGQGPVVPITQSLRNNFPGLEVMVVCGDNAALLSDVGAAFSQDTHVQVFGAVPTLTPLLAECACMITKPGISTILEGHAANRKLFLLKGMPVAEDNNARYAISHFNAEWFSISALRTWLQKT